MPIVQVFNVYFAFCVENLHFEDYYLPKNHFPNLVEARRSLSLYLSPAIYLSSFLAAAFNHIKHIIEMIPIVYSPFSICAF